ncbi:RNA polymerase sigma factor [Pedobacter psychroterrae]|nr:RNA polymerase sigma-70 factor [Pedobacter psychroterrae]
MPEYSILSDKELVKHIASGDKIAFSALYRRHWKELFGTASRVLRSEDQAEDVVQDVFLSLWDRRTSVDITGNVLAYLHTGIKYRSLNIIQKNVFERDYVQLLVETIERSEQWNAQELLQLKELQQSVNLVIGRMPTKMRAVYQLSRDKYFTHQQIADELGISKETVKKHIQHALQMLKEAIGPALLLLLLK